MSLKISRDQTKANGQKKQKNKFKVSKNGLKKKLRAAIYSLTCCEGCEFAILDMGKEFLNLMDHIDFAEFRLLEDQKDIGKYDVVFVEGSPITNSDKELLKQVRKKSKILVVLGNCAAMGGVHEIKNYKGVRKTIKKVYNRPIGLDNPPIDELGNIIKVDYFLHGCPINAKEFYSLCNHLIADQKFEQFAKPVCYECQSREYDCLLLKDHICLGPITRGGCEAVCLKGRLPCLGCRGLLPKVHVTKFIKMLKKKFTQKQIDEVLETFGLKDDVLDKIKQEKEKKQKK
jgi:coenzyme F420-reducing hydrogenase gamma subunit